LKHEELNQKFQRGRILKMSVGKIKSKIEKLVQKGDLKVGEIIKIKNLSNKEVISLEKDYKTKNNYFPKRQLFIDAKNSNKIIYTFELKYLGDKH